MKDISECPHESLYSETPRPWRPGDKPGAKPLKNGMLSVPERPEIQTDFCFDCQMWIYDSIQFDSTVDLIKYVNTGRVPEEFQWNVEVFFNRNDGTWNMYRTYIPYDGPTDEASILDPAGHRYNNAEQAALREFDHRSDIDHTRISIRGIASIRLEEV